jgi:hypothetical protein
LKTYRKFSQVWSALAGHPPETFMYSGPFGVYDAVVDGVPVLACAEQAVVSPYAFTGCSEIFDGML